MKSCPHPFSGSPSAPFSPSLSAGARPDLLLRPPLWCGGWQALFDYSAGLGCEVRRDAWVEIAGGSQPCGFV